MYSQVFEHISGDECILQFVFQSAPDVPFDVLLSYRLKYASIREITYFHVIGVKETLVVIQYVLSTIHLNGNPLQKFITYQPIVFHVLMHKAICPCDICMVDVIAS